jgi:small subunit ribosomal protein S16
LTRRGAKKRPFYRVVAADKRSPRDGRFIEMLGTFDPLQEPPVIRLKKDRIDYWLSVGAIPTDTVKGLVRKLEAGEAIDLSADGADEAARAERVAAKKAEVEAQREATAKAHAEAEKAAEKAAKEAEAAAKAEAEAEAAAAAAEAEGSDAAAEEAGDDVAEESSDDAAAEAGDEG